MHRYYIQNERNSLMPNQTIEHDVSAQQPGLLERFIGQQQIVERVRISLEAAWNDATRLPHMLFTGAPGLGKSLLCSVLAKEMGCTLKEQLGQNLNSPTDISAFLLDADDRDVLGIDECDEMIPPAQTALFRAIEGRKLFLPCNSMRADPTVVSLSDFTLLVCTNHEYQLVPPLRDRFKLVARFEPYRPDELIVILKQRTQQLGWNIDPVCFELVSTRSQGVPRRALHLIESAHRTARSEGCDQISTEHTLRTLLLEGIDDLGLDRTSQRYLQVLSESNGNVRVGVVASHLDLPPRSVMSIVEPFLLRERLIQKTDRGRTLTAKGWQHVRGTVIEEAE